MRAMRKAEMGRMKEAIGLVGSSPKAFERYIFGYLRKPWTMEIG